MAGTLYIHLPADIASDRVTWLLRGGDGPPAAGQGSLTDAGRCAAGARVVVFVPATQVVLIRAEVANVPRQRLRRALPYLLEEHLAEDVESLHFATGGRDADGALWTAVVERRRMDGWLEALQAVDVRPNVMLPDCLGLPFHDGQWTALLSDGGALLRCGDGRGFGLDGGDWTALLGLALEQAGDQRPSTLRLLDTRRADRRDLEPLRQMCAGHGVALEEERREQGVLELLVAGMGRTAALDLLQDRYSRREQLGRLWRPWRPAALMLLVLVILQGGLALVDQQRLAHTDQELKNQIDQLYRDTFPQARKVVDARQQMDTALKALRNGGGSDPFVTLMAKAGPVLDREAGLELRALRYKDGALEMDLTLTDLQSLDRLKQALLAAGGLQVDISTASARGDKVETRLSIREGSA